MGEPTKISIEDMRRLLENGEIVRPSNSSRDTATATVQKGTL